MNAKSLLFLLVACVADAGAVQCQLGASANAGCADQINGVNVWNDGTLQFDVRGHVQWNSGAVCRDRWLLQYRATNPGIAAQTSAALAASTVGKPISFRCSALDGANGCICESVGVGDTAAMLPGDAASTPGSGSTPVTTQCDASGTCISAPLEFEVYNADLTTWTCVDKDLREHCGDGDGCTIRLMMQNERSDQVLVITEDIYMEQPGKSKALSPGINGSTREGGAQYNAWITGTSAIYDIFFPWRWMYAMNYRPNECPDSLPKRVAYTNPYLFTFLSHPDVRLNVLILDR